MNLTLLNTDAELNSFPSTQNILLESSVKLEESVLKDSIILFRLPTENTLVSLAEPYSYNLGHLKENYDSIDMSFSVEDNNGKYLIRCIPKKPLPLDSVFNLYVKDSIPNESLVIDKVVSKTTSSIDANILGKVVSSQTIVIKILSTSLLKDGKNIVTFLIDNTQVSLNLKATKTYIHNNIEIAFLDTIYIKDEEFMIGVEIPSLTQGEFHRYIRTVNSSTITPIQTEDSSTRLSNKDILEFYKKMQSNSVVEQEVLIPKYLAENVFSLLLPEGFVLDTSDLTLFKAFENVAFNNFLLKSIGLYDDSKKYIIILHKDFFEGREIIFEVVYSENTTQTEKIVFDFTGVL